MRSLLLDSDGSPERGLWSMLSECVAWPRSRAWTVAHAEQRELGMFACLT